jgi:hypothetical protein
VPIAAFHDAHLVRGRTVRSRVDDYTVDLDEIT